MTTLKRLVAAATITVALAGCAQTAGVRQAQNAPDNAGRTAAAGVPSPTAGNWIETGSKDPKWIPWVPLNKDYEIKPIQPDTPNLQGATG